METQIVGIPVSGLPATWPRVLPLIEGACERSGGVHGPESFYMECETGKAQLWVAVDDEVRAVFVTAIVKTPKRTIAEVRVATGEGREDWEMRFMDVFEAWARENGADRTRLIAREGWKRVMKPRGYVPLHVILEKDL